jgi:hypothetical protein
MNLLFTNYLSWLAWLLSVTSFTWTSLKITYDFKSKLVKDPYKNMVQPVFLKIIIFLKFIFFRVFWSFWYAEINNNFLKIKKYIILMYFSVKNTLKNNYNHTLKHALSIPLLRHEKDSKLTYNKWKGRYSYYWCVFQHHVFFIEKIKK